MNENPYKYLFPYEKILVHSRIIIYGAGTLGQDYLHQMQLTGYCEVIAIADKNYSQYPQMIVPVIPPERIHEFAFDYIVVALRMAAAFNEVKRILKREKVADEKIVCIFEREKLQNSIFKEHTTAMDSVKKQYAFSKSYKSIAILSTGGFGDMVIQKRLIMEIIRLMPDCVIDFYNIKAIDLLKHLYSACKNINLVMPDLGSRYNENYKRYTLALTIEACHFIKVDKWDREVFDIKERKIYQEFIYSIDKLKSETDKEEVNISTPAHLTLIRRAYQGLNAYSGFNYNGAFEIKDNKVPISLDEKWKPEFEKLGLERYLTVNFGNGDCADGSRVSKSWSKENFEKFIYYIKLKYKNIDVIQVGAGNSERLIGADRYILGTDFRLSMYLLKNSLLHIDIEGGLVHLATQLGTKCAVLFGPTVKEYYGYEQNINIQVGNCHNCWGLYSDVNKCARGMKKPECMYSITPEIVMDYVEKYLDLII